MWRYCASRNRFGCRWIESSGKIERCAVSATGSLLYLFDKKSDARTDLVIGSSVALWCVRLRLVRVDQRVSWNLRLIPKSCIVEG